MNEHEKIADLIPFYVSGNISDREKVRVQNHLKTCQECQKDSVLWESISRSISQDLKRAEENIPEDVLDRSFAAIRKGKIKRSLFLKFIHIVQAQIPLVAGEIWAASLLVLILGFAVGLIADKVSFIYALAPLVSAGGLAFIYGQEQDPSYELVLTTPVSQVQILFARSALVFIYNILAVGLLSIGLSQYYSSDIVLPLLGEWLAPMAFLSSLSLCISIITNAEKAVFISYFLWISKYMVLVPEFKKLFGQTTNFFLVFWQTPAALYFGSLIMLAGIVLYFQKKNRLSRPAL